MRPMPSRIKTESVSRCLRSINGFFIAVRLYKDFGGDVVNLSHEYNGVLPASCDFMRYKAVNQSNLRPDQAAPNPKERLRNPAHPAFRRPASPIHGRSTPARCTSPPPIHDWAATSRTPPLSQNRRPEIYGRRDGPIPDSQSFPTSARHS